MATAAATQMKATNSVDLRDWLKDVKQLEQLEQISGAHWDLEIGALTEIILERMSTPPGGGVRQRSRFRSATGACLPTCSKP